MSVRAREICHPPKHCEIYRTANSEYHVHTDMMRKVCIAVVDRASQRENRRHRAIGLYLKFGMNICSTGSVTPHTLPEVGDRLVFAKPGPTEHYQSVLSSELISIETP